MNSARTGYNDVTRRYVVVSNRGCNLSNDTSRSSRRLSDAYIVCNHGLQSLSGNTAHSQHSDVNVSSACTTKNAGTSDYLSCGECNILGNYGRSSRGNFLAASSHADFSDNNNETMETDLFSFSSSNSQFFPTSLRSSSYTGNNRGKTFLVNNNATATSFSNSRTFDNSDAMLPGNIINYPTSFSRDKLLSTCNNTSPGAFASFTSYRPFSSYTPFSSHSPHDTNWIVIRGFHTGSTLREESKSKAEETVKALIEEAKEKLAEKDKPKPKEERKNVEDHVVQALKPTPKPGKDLYILNEYTPKPDKGQYILREYILLNQIRIRTYLTNTHS